MGNAAVQEGVDSARSPHLFTLTGAGSTQHLSEDLSTLRRVETFCLPLVFMHYSHIIKKSCRTFNYLLHNYNHICIPISRSPVS